MNTLGNSFRNSHGGISSLESGLRTCDLDHSGFFGKEASDCVFAEEPEPGEFSDRVVSFESWNTQCCLLLDGICRDVCWSQLKFHSAPLLIRGCASRHEERWAEALQYPVNLKLRTSYR